VSAITPESCPSWAGARTIRVFVLASAARRARGQGQDFNSMLIHVARFVSVQKKVYEYVEEELENLRRDRANGSQPVWPELQTLWKRKFVPCTRAINDPKCPSTPWANVEREVREAVERIKPRLINGEAGDILDYHEHPEGINIIAIGGDKLSRGLTLKGLTVSYYVRASRMYDTLMQMGR
jgi:hypothetical protein